VLFEFALELTGREIPRRFPVVCEGWDTLLRSLPRRLAQSPRRFAGSISNARYNLAQVPGARAREWLTSMGELGSTDAEVETILEAGQVAAWRAGLAHFRQPALAICRRLDARLARIALGLSASGADLGSLLDALQADPWVSPATLAAGANKNRVLRLVAAVGAFRGFGGPFLRPPRVASVDNRFLVGDGEGCWILCADVFGATLTRVALEMPQDSAATSRFRLDKQGKVSTAEGSCSFPILRDATSMAATDTTLAVTTLWTHKVYLVAC
jgi:hypothetical protein